jgi:hypothetical protein
MVLGRIALYITRNRLIVLRLAEFDARQWS